MRYAPRRPRALLYSCGLLASTPRCRLVDDIQASDYQRPVRRYFRQKLAIQYSARYHVCFACNFILTATLHEGVHDVLIATLLDVVSDRARQVPGRRRGERGRGSRSLLLP